MKKRLMAMLLISAMVLSCIGLNIAATGGPVVSIDNVVCPTNQNTTDLITVPIRTTGFTGSVTTVGVYVTFDNTKISYDKTCALGNIPVSDGSIPTDTWIAHDQFAQDNANATGTVSFICDNPLIPEVKSYLSSNVIPGTQDIMYNMTFKRLEGATGTANINISYVLFDTNEIVNETFVTYSSVNGDIDTVNGSVTFADPETATPPPTADPYAIPPENIDINKIGTTVITDPYGKVGGSLVRVRVAGIIDPSVDQKVVMVKNVAARYTYYNGVYMFVALLDEGVTVDDVTVADGTPIPLLYGDATLNSAVDIFDVTRMKNALSFGVTVTNNFEYIVSDATGDGSVNIFDVTALKTYISHGSTSLPIMNK